MESSGGAECADPLPARQPARAPRRAGRGQDSDRPGPAASCRSLWRLAEFVWPHRGACAAGCLLTLAATGLGLVPPYLTMPLVDRVLIPRQSGADVPWATIINYLAALAAAALAAAALAWARSWTLAWVSERVAADLRSRAYCHLQRLSVDFFTTHRTGDLIARIGSDSERITDYLSLHLIGFFSDAVLIACTAAVLLWINPLLALVALAPFPFVLWLAWGVREQMRIGFAGASLAWGELTALLADTIPGIRVVTIFAQESREAARFDAANRAVVASNDRVNVSWSLFGPLVALATESGVLVVWAAGAWLIFSGGLTVGGLTAYLAYIARFYGRVEALIRIVPASQRAAASAERIFAILDAVPSVVDPPDAIQPGRLRGGIAFRGVHFRHGDREVLHGIDLVIEPGEMIGLVGVSGAGKTTLANLVCRFFDPSAGAILIDGIDLRRLSLSAYRRNLGVVLQEPFLFHGSVAANIAYGQPAADRPRIEAAARAAGAAEFIARLPAGYDSPVGERGCLLSGGERQRISIARALVVDPRILILDEATSSVDPETETVIQAAIDRLVTGRTTIAIAHRLATLRRADRLVVLDAGRIVEVGTHDELLAARGVYARLERAQHKAAVAKGGRAGGEDGEDWAEKDPVRPPA